MKEFDRLAWQILKPNEIPMSLNIKNEETCRLARELAELTGETITGAITVALRERLERKRVIEERIRKMHEPFRKTLRSLVT